MDLLRRFRRHTEPVLEHLPTVGALFDQATAAHDSDMYQLVEALREEIAALRARVEKLEAQYEA